MFSWAELQAVVGEAETRFAGIKGGYKAIRPSLVFSSREGQASVYSSASEIVGTFPEMVVDGPEKARSVVAAKKIKLQKKLEALSGITEAEAQKEAATLKQLAPSFRYHENIFIEIRMDVLKYDLIQQLKQEPVIDAENTPQRGYSIRIVLMDVCKWRLIERRYKE